MQIKLHKLNLEQSEEVYKECIRSIEVNQCYNNVFHVVTDFISKFRDKQWKVAYGYHRAVENLYARHCFIVNENGETIDPTIFTRESFNKDKADYVSFMIYDDVDDYLDALWKEKRQPALYRQLAKMEKTYMQPWANENNIILIG